MDTADTTADVSGDEPEDRTTDAVPVAAGSDATDQLTTDAPDATPAEPSAPEPVAADEPVAEAATASEEAPETDAGTASDDAAAEPVASEPGVEAPTAETATEGTSDTSADDAGEDTPADAVAPTDAAAPDAAPTPTAPAVRGEAPAGSEPPPGSPAAQSGLRSGEMVIGTVEQVEADEVVVRLADGALGVIGKRHLSANGQLEPSSLLAPGDQVEAAVLVRDDPKGRIVLSRAWALKQRAWEKIEQAFTAHTPVTGIVSGQVKGGLVVDVGTRAFLPASHVDLHHVDDLAPFIGQPIEALVAEADRANDKIVLSRRNLLRQHERAKANEFAATLAPGQVHRGRVSLLTDFGAFVDVAGVRGLVHLSELSWSRVERAADVVSVGDEVEVKVLGIKPGKKLSLSIRALTADPLSTLTEGEILTGTVTRLADFGAFVRVSSGAEGLVHVTELAEYRVHAPEEVVAPGDEVLVKVLRVDRRRRRVDLSVNQAVLYQ